MIHINPNGTLPWHWLLALTRVWLGAAGVHLDVSLCRHPQDVPLHIDVILAQVYPHLHVVAAALLRGVGVDVEQVNLKWNIFYESGKMFSRVSCARLFAFHSIVNIVFDLQSNIFYVNYRRYIRCKHKTHTYIVLGRVYFTLL